VFGFPNPVNEKAARVVAGVVAILGIVVLAAGARWLLVVLAYGFWARVLTGPTLSPLGRVAMRVVAPRLGPPNYVAGPPKRFAQGMGAAFTTSAAVLALGFGADTAADVLTVLLVVAATLESVFGLPRLPGLRAADARRRGARGDVRALREHLGDDARGRPGPPLRPGDRPVYWVRHNPWGRQASTWSIRRGGREPRFRAASLNTRKPIRADTHVYALKA